MAAPSQAADSAEIYLVQGLPTATVDVEVDGKQVEKGLKATGVAGPFKVKAGDHSVSVSSSGKTLAEATVKVGAGSSWDVVAHLPAPEDTEPTMTAYRNDLKSVPKDKSSLTVAHTAVRAAGRHPGERQGAVRGRGQRTSRSTWWSPSTPTEWTSCPPGRPHPCTSGPLKLTVQGGALNRVYAVGDPTKKTMNVAVHVLKVKTTGTDRPKKVDTGTGGQAVGAESGLQVDLVR